MSVWSTILLEGFCMYRGQSKKVWKMYKLKGEKFTPTKDRINKNYIPKSKRPTWCKNQNKKFIPNFRCLCDGRKDRMCPFFAFCDADKKDYKLFNRAWSESVKEEK